MTVLLPCDDQQNASSSACAAIDVFDKARPPRSEAFMSLLFGVAATLWCVFTLSIPVLFVLRNDARFSKVRPFSLSVALMVTSSMYVVGLFVPEAVDGFPCALVLFLHVFGATVVTSVTGVRALIFVVESQYAISVAKESPAVISDAASVTSADSSHKGETRDDFLFALKEALAIGRELHKVGIHALSQIRRRYLGIFVFVSLPPFVIYMIGVLSIPAYRIGCTDCPITIEFLLILLASPTFFLTFILRLLYLGSRFKQDEQQVMREIFLTMLLGPIWIYLGYAILIADPNQLGYSRVFPWQIIICIGTFMFWFVVVFMQCVTAIRDRTERAAQKSNATTTTAGGRVGPSSIASVSPRNLMEELDRDPELKNLFKLYAASRYCQESYNFLEDVKAYKLHFEESSEKWRHKNARTIMNTYIKANAAQQVNISEGQREAIMRTNIESSSAANLLVLFDSAFNDVLRLLHSGVWFDFNHMQRKHRKGSMVIFASHV